MQGKRKIMGLRPDGRRNTKRNRQIEKKWKNATNGKAKLVFLVENTE